MSGGTDYEVQPGDAIESIAEEHGFRSWEPIWNHDNNAALRQKRNSPQILAAGDVLFIPDKEPKEFKCQTNQVHTFRLRVPKRVIQQQLLDENGQPHGGVRYELAVEGGQTLSGKTDDKGMIKEEIDLSAEGATLTVFSDPEGEPEIFEMRFAHLEPIDTVAGVQARLSNLGYDCGEEPSGTVDDLTTAALKEFQRAHGLTASGEIDDPTRGALQQAHDQALED